jgi:hypothetical protein
LIDLNTAFYSSTKAPEYVLFKQQTIDDRFPTLDDAGVLKQLLYHYKPVLEENGYFLWKRIQPAAPIQSLASVTDSLAFDSEHTIPANEMSWVALEIKPSLLGRAVNLFYRPPEVAIRVTDSLGRQSDSRLVPSMASSGFIISPSLDTESQFVRTSAGAPPVSNRSFSVRVADGAQKFFQPAITCRISALPPIPTSELDEQARRLVR